MKKLFKIVETSMFYLSFWLYSALCYAGGGKGGGKVGDDTGIQGLNDMLDTGQKTLKTFAKWGGIVTVIGAAIALGSGKLEGKVAQTFCKILLVVGLIMGAFGYFADALSKSIAGS